MLAYVFALLIGAAHFVGDHFSVPLLKGRNELASLAGGIAVSYLILHLLPLLYKGTLVLERSLFVFVLIGFAAFHLVEKYVYRRYKPERLPVQLDLAHSYFIAVYYLLIGFVLVELVTMRPAEAMLFFIPVALYALLSSMSTNAIHGAEFHSPRSVHMNSIISVMPLVGAAISQFLILTPAVFYSIFAIIAGVMMYIFVRDTVPAESEGRPPYFIFGVVVYSAIIYALWLM